MSRQRAAVLKGHHRIGAPKVDRKRSLSGKMKVLFVLGGLNLSHGHLDKELRLRGLAMDRLRRLVFSFYREDPEIEAELEPLRDCRMSRSWGSIRIECIDGQHLEEVSGLMTHLRRPLLAMGLGRQIVLRVPGRPQRTYPMQVPFHSDLLT